mmetsp:Transcript_7554/g.18890  ORF Transcript_7554/g.18890 Transcript_7554/m.18890 type:complete len:262 (-) Transcript_7554:136-921(-)
MRICFRGSSRRKSRKTRTARSARSTLSPSGNTPVSPRMEIVMMTKSKMFQRLLQKGTNQLEAMFHKSSTVKMLVKKMSRSLRTRAVCESGAGLTCASYAFTKKLARIRKEERPWMYGDEYPTSSQDCSLRSFERSRCCRIRCLAFRTALRMSRIHWFRSTTSEARRKYGRGCCFSFVSSSSSLPLRHGSTPALLFSPSMSTTPASATWIMKSHACSASSVQSEAGTTSVTHSSGMKLQYFPLLTFIVYPIRDGHSVSHRLR